MDGWTWSEAGPPVISKYTELPLEVATQLTPISIPMFWMPSKSEKKIVVLDYKNTDRFSCFIRFYNIGIWKRASVDQDFPSGVWRGLLSVLDMTPYKGKVCVSPKLMMLSMRQIKQWRINETQVLRGSEWHTYRYDSKSSSTGSTFQYAGQKSCRKLPQPFDYATLDDLKPQPYPEIKAAKDTTKFWMPSGKTDAVVTLLDESLTMDWNLHTLKTRGGEPPKEKKPQSFTRFGGGRRKFHRRTE